MIRHAVDDGEYRSGQFSATISIPKNAKKSIKTSIYSGILDDSRNCSLKRNFRG